MFEIPDDDDLFSEENLKDILHDISHCPKLQDQTDPTTASTTTASTGHSKQVHGPSGSSRTVDVTSISAEERGGQRLGSPKTKKMRVLTDVNYVPTTSAVVHNAKADEVSAGQRNCTDVSSKALSSHHAVAAVAMDTESDVALPSRRRSLRKFPGPAGILPPAKPSELASLAKKSPGTSPEIVPENSHRKPEEEVSGSQTGGELFGGAAWRSLTADLEPGADSVLTKFSVRAMLHKASRRLLPKGKVPLMVGVLESIDSQGTDASVVLRDATGQMQGTLHREALKDFSLDLQTGAALVLRQVSVISPSSRTHYLNITAGNIVAIYPADAQRAPTVLPSSPDLTTSAQPCREKTIKQCIRAAEIELLEAANAAKESALSRLRQRGSPAQNSSPVSPHVSAPPRPGLFSNTPRIPVARGSASGPFTPHRSGQGGSSAVTAPASGGRFTFKNPASASPQVRAPTPGNRAMAVGGGDKSEFRISGGGSSSFPQGSSSVHGGSRFSNTRQQQTPGTPPSRVAGLPQSSAQARISGHSVGNRLEPPTPYSACNTTTQAIASGTPSGSSASCYTSDRAAGIRLAGAPTSTDPSHSNTSAPQSSSQQQQSKWTFKRKGFDPTPTQAVSRPSAASANGEGKWPRLQAGGLPAHAPTDGSPVRGEGSGSSVPLQASVASAGWGPGMRSVAAAAQGAGGMWDDELDDDILSQLSDDF
ncbi:uncharacterized protein LOC143285299 [Babylonia areolata]|uniref:uncharacterized protein LOC143285299 n=1 Tax=Babylonia areolata TaxID=304850 RepID=UPI003FD2F310